MLPEQTQVNNALEKLNLLVQSMPGTCAKTEPNTALGLSARLRSRMLQWLLGREAALIVKDLPDFVHMTLQSLNSLEKKCSYRELEISELVRMEVERLSVRISAEISAVSNSQAIEVGRLNSVEAQLEQLDSICRGLESIIARLSRASSSSQAAESSTDNPGESASTSAIDYSYLMLENRYRGSEKEISQRLAEYVPLFAGSSFPVLEIGAGRGELQALFAEADVPSYGVELDQAMVEASCELGFDVRFENGISHLKNLDDNSLSGVIAIQVVEHLPKAILEELLALCRQKVVKGGRVVLETINTSSMVALTHNYFRDPTHAHPLHPDTMSYMSELAGLEVLEIRKRSPYPAQAQLQTIQEDVFYPERWRQILQQYNSTIAALNSLLFGFQDYALIAQPRD